jgi:hypothetical protein
VRQGPERESRRSEMYRMCRPACSSVYH